MNQNTKQKLSVGISVVLHVILLLAAFKTVVMVFAPTSRETGSLIRVRIDSKKFSPPAGEAKLKEQQAAVEEVREITPAALNPAEQTIEPSFQHPSVSTPAAQETLIVAAKSPVEVMDEKGSGPATQKMAMSRNVQSKLIATEDVLKDSVAASAESVNRASVKPVAFGYGSAAKDAGAGTLTGISSSGEEGLQGIQDQNMQVPFDRKTNAKDIKSFLGYELQTYEDPSDHVKYFRLSIRVEDTPVTLPSIPKELIFLIDASNSIGKERFDLYKRGVEDVISQLGLKDKFNVMVFKKAVVKFSETSRERNPSNIGNAVDFLKAFSVGSKTDVYDAVLKSIDMKDAMKPAYIFLLSDGQPTEGVTDPQQIINQIARGNKGRVPVFAFGGGSFVNEYLLDFLSFTNRGWAEFYPYQINKKILEMYNRIKDPVLLELRYYVSGLDEKEMYPKLLPDFFRGSKFVLYGRYTDEKSFFLELLGDSQSEVKQYRINDDISSAPKGDRDIARNWAFRKVYNLISKIEYNKDNKALIDEVKVIAKKFDLKIPNID